MSTLSTWSLFDEVEFSGSPYLARPRRELWEVCRDRLSWNGLGDAPCLGGALTTTCDRRVREGISRPQAMHAPEARGASNH